MELITRATRGRPPETIRSKEERQKCYPRGRRCRGATCKHLLSVYNPGPLCHACRAEEADFDREFAELMAEARS